MKCQLNFLQNALVDLLKKRFSGQSYSLQAKKFLDGMVLNKTVDIRGCDLRPYNRILGVLSANGNNT